MPNTSIPPNQKGCIVKQWSIEAHDNRLCRVRSEDGFQIGSIDLVENKEGKKWLVELYKTKGIRGGPYESKTEAIAFVRGVEAAMRVYRIGVRPEAQ
jgi:hypothetical protein